MFFFFFNDTATTEIYTLSLHDALPISAPAAVFGPGDTPAARQSGWSRPSSESSSIRGDRKSTRLNSSHSQISYAVFCLKKKTAHPEPHAPASRTRPALHTSHGTPA